VQNIGAESFHDSCTGIDRRSERGRSGAQAQGRRRTEWRCLACAAAL